MSITAIRVSIVFSLFFAWTLAVGSYASSVQKTIDEREALELKVKTDTAVKNALVSSREQEARSFELANKINALKHENEQKINSLSADNRRLFDELWMHKRKNCHDAGRVSKDRNPERIVAAAEIDESQLHARITEFFVAESERADEIRAYADVSFAWVSALCADKKRFIC